MLIRKQLIFNKYVATSIAIAVAIIIGILASYLLVVKHIGLPAVTLGIVALIVIFVLGRRLYQPYNPWLGF